MVPNRPFHPTEVSRRQLLFTTGAFLAGGGVVAGTATEPTQAVVSTNALNIPPAEHIGEDGSVADLTLEVHGNWEFQAQDAETAVLTLLVASDDSSDYQAIDETEQSLATDSGAGQYTLSGSLLEHSSLDAGMFSAEPQEVVTHELPIRVRMDVIAGGETVVSALAETVASIRVENTSVKASAAVLGEGTLGIEV